MNIFQQTDVPASRRRNRIQAVSRWYTWSDEFRGELQDLLPRVHLMGIKPRIRRIKGLKRYDYSLSVLDSPMGRYLVESLKPWSKSLQSVNPAGIIWMMRGLLDGKTTSRDVRLLFAGLRDAMVREDQEEKGALYAPLGDTGGAPTEFPLHCDLYIPRRLLNIFDDVSVTDLTGASIFLPTADMLQMARECGVSSSDISLLRSYLKAGDGDHYDPFYRLLYSNADGFAALDRKMRRASFRIRLNRGEGYLIDDRVWMHGRTLTSRAVTRNRLHRLVF